MTGKSCFIFKTGARFAKLRFDEAGWRKNRVVCRLGFCQESGFLARRSGQMGYGKCYLVGKNSRSLALCCLVAFGCCLISVGQFAGESVDFKANNQICWK